MTTRNALTPDDVTASSAGGMIRAYDIASARRAVAHAAAHAPEPVLSARVRLIHHRDPAHECPYTAQANLDVNGHPVQAHAAAETVGRAIGALDERLRSRLARLTRHHEHRSGPPSPDDTKRPLG